MLRKLSQRLTYANVMSTIAVFGVLATGTAYAANTVFSTDIVDGEVKSVDIANDSIQSGDVKDNSINTFDVHSFLGVDVVDGTLTGADVAANAISGGTHIVDGSVSTIDIFNDSVNSQDIADGSLNSQDIADGSLNDEDIGQGTFVDFAVNVGLVPSNGCKLLDITGVNAGGDHLLLTPNSTDSESRLLYSAAYRPNGSPDAKIKVCNPIDGEIDDGTTHFNLLIIDAQ